MLIIRSKKNAAYKIAVTDYGLAVVNETNSWSVLLMGPTQWRCEHENLPQYVKTWLNEISRKQNWAGISPNKR